jgi:N-glycosidase YbiA
MWMDEFSNFHQRAVSFDGDWYRTNEHAFQAMKTLDPAERSQIRQAKSPGQAKRLGGPASKGGIVTLRADWEQVKQGIMLDLCRQKFGRPPLSNVLLATNDEQIVEANTWHDNIWGDCTCSGCADKPGQNLLGKILMQIREELKTDPAIDAPPPVAPAPSKKGIMRLVIAGSRDYTNGNQFDDYGFLAEKVSLVCSAITVPIIVLNGTARGADRMGERWGKEHGHQVEPWPADWVLYGNSAGMLRNRRMLETATHACFFWNGRSNGTKHAIAVAAELGVKYRVWTIT